MKRKLLFLGLLFWLQFGFGQKILRLETSTNLKKKEYFVGSNITFRLKDDPNWYNKVIQDMDFNKKLLIFEIGTQSIMDIDAVKISRRSFISTTSGILRGGGVSFAFFGTGGWLVNRNCMNCRESLIMGSSMWALGQLLTWISPRRKFKIGGNNQLRLIEINFAPQTNN